MSEVLEKEVVKPINDYGIAAYLLMHGFEILNKRGKVINFKIKPGDEKEFDEKTVEYLSGPYHRFDSCLMAIRKL